MDIEQTSSIDQPQSSPFTGENVSSTPSEPSLTPTPPPQPPTTMKCPPPLTTVTESKATEGSRKRKNSTRKVSKVWEHFTKLPLEETTGEVRAACKYCNLDYACDPGKHGLTSLKRHVPKCSKNPHKATQMTKQSILNYVTPSGQEGSLVPHMFNQKRCRRALVEFIICDEMPFRLVEKEGFKKILKNLLKKCTNRLCLTTDCWTSVQNFNYLCLTAYFIDNDWNLHKRVLSFCMVENHKGDTIGKTIERCLSDWGIQNVFTITMDNATSNDIALSYLKRHLKNWRGLVCGGDYLQLRCSAHILNLVVNDELKELKDTFESIRNAIRYVRSSLARLQRFKDVCELEMLDTKSIVCLDVSTRWNSTYLMLDVALKFQKAFERLEDEDEDFVSYFNKGSKRHAQIDFSCLKGSIDAYVYRQDARPDDNMDAFAYSRQAPPKRNGPPNKQAWNKARFFLKFLKVFYDVTLQFSSTLKVTAHTCFHQIALIQELLDENVESDDPLLREMSLSMKRKYDKYWGAADNLNPLLIIAVILDPRYKLAYINHVFDQRFPAPDLCMSIKNKARDTLYRLFEEYSATIGPDTSSSGSINSPSALDTNTSNASKGKKDPGRRCTSEDTPIDDDDDDFDILTWWKVNSTKYRVLSLIARDVLAVPVSTVASESVFSTGGRVIDDYRSSLSPKMTEALICAQNWLVAGQSLSEFVSMFHEVDNFQETDDVVNVVGFHRTRLDYELPNLVLFMKRTRLWVRLKSSPVQSFVQPYASCVVAHGTEDSPASMVIYALQRMCCIS
ncbi:zinc finger BED domain-containing protein RICESLEEPER 2-like [Prosopis cineraria]|uniref:zinc finger BED domain-containing protein RICESLEEPER 2-like n=1 Tax=Prosopis cineraria TaxID=364024 RepID=UPI0024105AE2|nr:zinc finger BED domain-containing protein RICESLEEPER 2-like [Prosopis cineraria]